MRVTVINGRQGDFESWFSGHLQQELPVLNTNASSADYMPVVNAAGTGMFPVCACALDGKIAPLEIDLHRPLDISL